MVEKSFKNVVNHMESGVNFSHPLGLTVDDDPLVGDDDAFLVKASLF